MPETRASLSGLNPDQQAAVLHDAGPLIVLAGPGTGKTRVIIARVRRLLEDGAEPESILAVTFSVKAAGEMRERLCESVGAAVSERVNVSTFHALGSRFVSRFGDWIGLRPASELVLMDSAQRTRLVRELIREHGLYPMLAARGRVGVAGEALSFIAACRNADRTPAQALSYASCAAECASRGETPDGSPVSAQERDGRQAQAELLMQHAVLYEKFDDECFERGLVTYDDYLSLPLRIFREKPASASIVRAELRHVVVDEFQDVNEAQVQMLVQLAPPASGSGEPPDLCVVGDDDQAIYAFRGTDPRAFERFASLWAGCRTIKLERNYRSARRIVAAANEIISKAQRFDPGKSLVAEGHEDGAVEGVIVPHDDETGSTVAAMILADRGANPGRAWTEYAVICRTNSFRDQVAEELKLHGVPIDLRIPATPLDDAAVLDTMAWLRLVSSSDSVHDAQRLLVRPIGGCDPRRVSLWRDRYREFLGTLEPGDETPAYLDWLADSQPENEAAHRLRSMLRGFRVHATERADRLIERIVRETRAAAGDGAGTDELTPRRRARRVENLVQVIRFARDRQQHLDPPGDVASFLAYYDDLDDDDRQFRAPDERSLDRDDYGDGDGPGGVRVLTAHKAKGLEFDTVFVVRARPGHGYPKSDRDGGSAFPLDEAFTGRARGAHADEERRVFYVACTRAKRRLVLVAKSKNKPRKQAENAATDYYFELQDAGPCVAMIEHSAAWCYEQAKLTPPSSVSDEPPHPAESARESAVRRELDEARRRAFDALRAVGAGTLSPDALRGVVATLTEATYEVAALSALRSGADPGVIEAMGEEGAPGHDAAARAVRRVAQLIEGDAEEGGLFAPMKPPLTLSYSKVNAYLRCPRCFYLENVLKLSRPDSDEQSFGLAAHAALSQYYAERQLADDEGRPLPGVDRLIALARMALRRAVRGPVDPLVMEQMEAQLQGVVAVMEHNDAERHQHLEQFAGVMFSAGGSTHRLVGKLDRVDAMPDGTWRVVDYKTGHTTKSLIEPKKDDLQLGVYALLLPELLGSASGDGPPSGCAEYWCLSTLQRGTINLEDLQLDKVQARIVEAAEGMLQGRFDRGKVCSGWCALLGD